MSKFLSIFFDIYLLIAIFANEKSKVDVIIRKKR